ncbi:DUF4406 domain-containing protein [Enterobacter mori]|uniref:DUF4406 domain-containing protein n=1 Tax=Enterobacter mori TaxID=539813 RepID=UPI003B844CE8
MKDNTVIADALRIMIAGPMTGYEDFNRPLFNQVADELRERGFIVYNPAILPDGWSHDEYLAVTLGWVDEVDGLFMLDGWEHSKGALREFDRMMRRCIPVLHFQSLDAFRAALTRSRVLAGALVSRPGSVEGSHHAAR